MNQVNEIIDSTIKNLQRNNIGAYYAKTRDNLIDTLSRLLQKGETIGCGDSVTLEETGVFNFIRKGGYNFLDKHRPELSSSDKRELYLQSFRSDTFLSGVNAITQTGHLYFIDGNGSRIAPIIYGPRQVILVSGTNKIVSDSNEALTRIRQVAAPMDAKRLCKNTPCSKTGQCIDCKSIDRICNDFLCITRQFEKNRIKVLFIDGNWGF